MNRRFLVDGEPRISGSFIGDLLRHQYTTHVRELEFHLWQAMQASPEDVIVSPRTLEEQARDDQAADGTVKPGSLTREEIRACLDRCGGSREQAWRALGLRSRYQLHRLLEKHGLADRPKNES